MCGIAGIVDPKQPVRLALIRRMTDTLRHRGPDDEGYLGFSTRVSPPGVDCFRGPDSSTGGGSRIDSASGEFDVVLGHRRLAILDLSPAGHQPMTHGNGLWIVFNGEIYNYVELRAELAARGFEFKTNTDTEVILAAYAHWGKDCVQRFNGDWAFCILDVNAKELFLCRDRYGIKPLFYQVTDEGRLLFASEIAAILTTTGSPPVLDQDAAAAFLIDHTSDGAEHTFFKGIMQLEPAHRMTFDLRSGETLVERYYDLPDCPELGTYNERQCTGYVADIRDLLFDSVKLRLRSDVPVGTCLSGGLDSSALVAIMNKMRGDVGADNKLQTFTSSFPGQTIDETRFAEIVIQHVGAQPHFIQPTRADYERQAATIMRHQQEPFPSNSVFAQWEVLLTASRHVSVILDGQAADELFAGYRNYRASFLANLLTRGRLIAFARELRGTVRNTNDFKHAVAEIKSVPFFALPNAWKPRLISLLKQRHKPRPADGLGPARNQPCSQIETIFNNNVNTVLADALKKNILPRLLRFEDRNSMAHSIEARVPFTDYRLVDYLFKIPSSYKIHNGWTKWLLRRAVEDLLPAEIVWRKDKLGFAAPSWESRDQLWTRWEQQTFGARLERAA